jgi:hypothetical protein
MKSKFSKALLVGAVVMACGAAHAEVTIRGNNNQRTTVLGFVTNAAVGLNATANQNLSSNHGQVTIGGNNEQRTTVLGFVTNAAVGLNATANQNLSSNSSH